MDDGNRSGTQVLRLWPGGELVAQAYKTEKDLREGFQLTVMNVLAFPITEKEGEREKRAYLVITGNKTAKGWMRNEIRNSDSTTLTPGSVRIKLPELEEMQPHD